MTMDCMRPSRRKPSSAAIPSDTVNAPMPRLCARSWKTGAVTAPTSPQKPQLITDTGIPDWRIARPSAS